MEATWQEVSFARKADSFARIKRLRAFLMDMAGGEFYNKIVLKITELFKEASGWVFHKNSQLFCA